MTSFTFSAEQLRAAPPDVRRWMEAQILAELGRPAPEHPAEPALAACAPDLIEQILALIGRHGPAGSVLLAFAAGTMARDPSGLCGLPVADLARRAGVADRDQLVECIDLIEQAYRRLHGAASAPFFGFDNLGHIYIHAATYRGILQVLADAARAPAPLDAPLARAAGLMEGMPVPQLGPSEALPHGRLSGLAGPLGA